jgi:hypothetical protein
VVARRLAVEKLVAASSPQLLAPLVLAFWAVLERLKLALVHSTYFLENNTLNKTIIVLQKIILQITILWPSITFCSNILFFSLK